jgi:solute carrier family 45 protein 1/2/4
MHARAFSTPLARAPEHTDERMPLLRSHSTADVENSGESMEYTGSGPVAGGTIMGIHNLAIVIPQFIVSDWSSTTLTQGGSCRIGHLQISRW